jgi:hypothetical protein
VRRRVAIGGAAEEQKITVALAVVGTGGVPVTREPPCVRDHGMVRVPPRLHPEDLDDEDAMYEALGSLWAAEGGLRKRSRRIVRMQHRLRRATSDRAWKIYLELETADLERLEHALLCVAKWAFREGFEAGIASENAVHSSPRGRPGRTRRGRGG